MSDVIGKVVINGEPYAVVRDRILDVETEIVEVGLRLMQTPPPENLTDYGKQR
ncbi:hypothetical protein [Acetonema longum]|uniref:Uncharacterized protein n=1 Tax=Acetonema longum DSM 6540 TaxID=1009370 RepID=F7NK71_9FIRM|nr:hypothetical protein [Acetonema longum]EGO63512.1 hypothetical protein ALO_12421 [Acetonema longum DSM 6540]